MVQCTVQVSLLTQDLAHRDVHVTGAPQHRPARRVDQVQHALEDVLGGAQVTLREKHVGGGDGAARDVGPVAHALEDAHRVGVAPLSRCQVPAGPQGKP